MKKPLLFALFLCLLVIARVFAQPPRVPRIRVPKIEVVETQLPDAKVQDSLTNLLLAIENADYDRFVGELTLNFRAHVDEILFKQIHESHGRRMAQGYHVVYMGELNKPGFKTFVYKLVFKDKGGDVLAHQCSHGVPDKMRRTSSEELGQVYHGPHHQPNRQRFMRLL